MFVAAPPGEERDEMETFFIRLVDRPLVFVLDKRRSMTCMELMSRAGLGGYELLVEEHDFPVHPDERLDFIENGQVLYATRAK